MFGLPEHEPTNTILNRALTRAKPAVVAHRGVGHASIAPNTSGAVRAALLSGADLVQVPVTASADMYFFAFHDGHEPEHLGIDRNLQTMPAHEIRELSYVWRDRPGRIARVEPLLELLSNFRDEDVVFILDRSWWRWPHLLVALDTLRMPGQLIVKAPAWESEAISRLQRHPVKYPFVPICSNPGEAEKALSDKHLNLVGLELITNSPHSPWFDAGVLSEYRRRRAFVLVNTSTLTTGIPQFGGYDDEGMINSSPVEVLQLLFDLGVDAIQTDWPWLLRDYRDRVGSVRPGPADSG